MVLSSGESHRKNLRPEGLSYSIETLLQRLGADFLEKDDVVIAVILEADVALERTRAMLRFEIKFALGDRLAFGVVGNGDIVENHDGAWAIESDYHGVP